MKSQFSLSLQDLARAEEVILTTEEKSFLHRYKLQKLFTLL